MTIRPAAPEDANDILAIYAHYVENTAVSFDYDTPSPDEMRERIRGISRRYPFLAALDGGKIVGYAYASAFKDRAAYDRAVELTVYLAPDCVGKGFGHALYAELEERLRKQNVLNFNACIAYPGAENDPHLTGASVRFHEKSGYKTVARFTKCGYKFGKWYDMIWMEKLSGEHPDDPPPFIPACEL